MLELRSTSRFRTSLWLGTTVLVLVTSATSIAVAKDDEKDANDKEATTQVEEPITDTSLSNGDGLSIESVEGFNANGGSAVIDPETTSEETIWYGGIDSNTNELLEVSRTEPVSHDSGAAIATSTTATAVYGETAMEITTDGSKDGNDYLYRLSADGLPLLVGTYPLGTLEAIGDSNGKSSSNPRKSNLTRTQVHCLENENAYAEGYHCLHIYKPSQPDGSSTYNYRYGWWTGSDHAKCCNDLNESRDSIWFPAEAPAGQEIITWKPNGTAQPTSCNDITLALNVTRGGVGLNVESTFSRCQSWYGPHDVGSSLFAFKWTGEKDNATWIGMGGGAEWRYRDNGNGWKIKFRTYHKWCTPDWACQ